MPKNALQFLVGAACFYYIFNTIDVFRTLLGMVALCITYASVYPFNDIMDLKEDIKHKKHRLKPIVRGDMTVEEAASLSFILLAVGLTISAVVSTVFTVLLLLLLIINFMHSSNFIKLRNSPLRSPNMILMQFVKFSTGWFALTSSPAGFPFLIIFCLSLVYTYGYLLYKVDIRNRKAIEENGLKFWLIVAVSLATYIVAFLLYDFDVPMIITAAAAFPMLLIITKPRKLEKRIDAGLTLPPLLLLIFVVACLLRL
jgi:4-hydroxybenzoate polyprenyltransferase